MNHEEAKIQAALCLWLQKHGYYFFSIPNEAAGRSMVQTMQLVSMGLRKGAADLVIVLPDARVLFVEVKAPNGTQSPAQVKFQERVESLGHTYAIVRSVSELSYIIL